MSTSGRSVNYFTEETPIAADDLDQAERGTPMKTIAALVAGLVMGAATGSLATLTLSHELKASEPGAFCAARRTSVPTVEPTGFERWTRSLRTSLR